METLEESATRPTKRYRAVVIGSLLAFLCVLGLAYRAVEVAQEGADDNRRQAQAAREEVKELQRQQDCTIRVLAQAVNGLLKNSIQQNDVLLVSAEAGDRQAVIDALKATRAELVSIAAEAAKVDQECT